MYYLFGFLLFLYFGFLSAWTVALAARFSSRVMQLLSAFLTTGLQLAIGCILLYGVWILEYPNKEIRGFFIPFAAMLFSNALLLVSLLIMGLRRKENTPHAKHWPQGLIMLALLSFAFLAAITYGAIDHSNKQFLLDQDAIAVNRLKEILERDDAEAASAAEGMEEVSRQFPNYPDLPQVYIDWLEKKTPKEKYSEVFTDPSILAHEQQVEPLLQKVREFSKQAALKPTFPFPGPGEGSGHIASHTPSVYKMLHSLLISTRAKACRGEIAPAMQEIAVNHRVAALYAQNPHPRMQIIAISNSNHMVEVLTDLLQTYELSEAALAILPDDLRLNFQQKVALSQEVEGQAAMRDFVQHYLGSDSSIIEGEAGTLEKSLKNLEESVGRFFAARSDIAGCQQFMQHRRLALDLPLPERLAIAADSRKIFRELRLTSYAEYSLNYELIDNLTPACMIDAKLLVSQAALAAHRYRLQHGDFPASLDVLQTFDPTLDLIDPYTGQPLHMLHQDSNLTIYSVGPNLQDDGGAEPVSNTPGKLDGDIPFRLHLPK